MVNMRIKKENERKKRRRRRRKNNNNPIKEQRKFNHCGNFRKWHFVVVVVVAVDAYDTVFSVISENLFMENEL